MYVYTYAYVQILDVIEWRWDTSTHAHTAVEQLRPDQLGTPCLHLSRGATTTRRVICAASANRSPREQDTDDPFSL